MDVVYATLIIHGYRTFDSVPASVKDATREVLFQLGFPELTDQPDGPVEPTP